jgi:hypothetical protein
MAVLVRQVKVVEESPWVLRQAPAGSELANVVGVGGGGGGGAAYVPPPVAETYESGEVVAEEAAAAPVQPQAAPPALPQGQDLAPRAGRRGWRARGGS